MRYILIPFTLPMFIFGYLYVLLFTILGATRRHRFDKEMWTWECVWADWVIKPRKGLTWNPFGRLFLWQPGQSWPEGKMSVFNDEEGRWLPVGSKTENPDDIYARNIWKYGTTLAYGIIYAPGALPEDDTTEDDTRHERHEDVHVRQGQDEVVLGFLVGLVVAIGMWVHADIGTGFAWWAAVWMSSVTWRLPNMLTAVLRGGHVYRDAEHERSAYAQTDRWPNGSSWIEKHRKRKNSW